MAAPIQVEHNGRTFTVEPENADLIKGPWNNYGLRFSANPHLYAHTIIAGASKDQVVKFKNGNRFDLTKGNLYTIPRLHHLSSIHDKVIDNQISKRVTLKCAECGSDIVR